MVDRAVSQRKHVIFQTKNGPENDPDRFWILIFDRALESHGLSYPVKADRLRCHPPACIDCTLGTAFPVEAVVGDLKPFTFTEKEYGMA